ncbi:hypothetical protein OCAR_5802 [Afipia carboxidovorans OM5]|nr:hypothetical protein OCAR_5802 [Afipia carboxidovorans OM5]
MLTQRARCVSRNGTRDSIASHGHNAFMHEAKNISVIRNEKSH